MINPYQPLISQLGLPGSSLVVSPSPGFNGVGVARCWPTLRMPFGQCVNSRASGKMVKLSSCDVTNVETLRIYMGFQWFILDLYGFIWMFINWIMYFLFLKKEMCNLSGLSSQWCGNLQHLRSSQWCVNLTYCITSSQNNAVEIEIHHYNFLWYDWLLLVHWKYSVILSQSISCLLFNDGQ